MVVVRGAEARRGSREEAADRATVRSLVCLCISLISIAPAALALAQPEPLWACVAPAARTAGGMRLKSKAQVAGSSGARGYCTAGQRAAYARASRRSEPQACHAGRGGPVNSV